MTEFERDTITDVLAAVTATLKHQRDAIAYADMIADEISPKDKYMLLNLMEYVEVSEEDLRHCQSALNKILVEDKY